MGRIFDTLVKFFQEDDWKFRPHEEKSMIHLGFYSITPVKAAEKVRHNIALTDKYLPGIMAVCFGGASPAEAIKKIEG